MTRGKPRESRSQEKEPRCPICRAGWHRNREVKVEQGPNGNPIVECRDWCGRFEVEGDLSDRLSWGKYPVRTEGELIQYLSCHTRQSSESGDLARITNGNWRSLAEQHRATRTKEKSRLLLRLLAKRAGGHDRTAAFRVTDRLLVDEPHEAAFHGLIIELVHKQRIVIVNEEPAEPGLSWIPLEYQITYKGMAKYEASCDRPAVNAKKSRDSKPAKADYLVRAFYSRNPRPTQAEMCQELDSAKVHTPLSTRWSNMLWKAAYMDPEFRPSVKKWLTKHGKPP